MASIPSPTSSPSIAVNAPSATATDPEPLLSPTAVSIHCVESMFPGENDGFQTSAIGSQDPASEAAEIASTATATFEDARSNVTLTDIEERLRTASMSGSIHELQEEVASRKSSKSASEGPISPNHVVVDKDAVSRLSADDSDAFEDAQEEMSRHVSPQHSSQDSPAIEASQTEDARDFKDVPKHIFVLSDAGKPIFTLHGDEDELASLMAVMQAMVSYVADMGDSLRSIVVGGKKIVFLSKGPLILVAVSQGKESIMQLSVQLTYIYHQILSVVTQSHLTKIFEQRKGYDLRRMIAGSERLIRSLSSAMDSDPCFMLSAVRVLPMPSSAREDISKAISKECSKAKNVVFAILIAENQLVTLTRMKKYFIHPADLHLIFSLINSTESFKVSEAWIPICLPKFDSSGFMHAHVSYLTEDCPACLIMLTVEKDIFFELSDAKRKIIESLDKTKSMSAISDALSKSEYSPDTAGIPEVRHFLYKAKSAAQFTSSKLRRQPYAEKEAARRLHETYLQLQNRMHSQQRPLKLMYLAGKYENVLSWATQSFELYAAFAPTTSKTAAINAINKLLKWCKKEEGTLFILNAPTF